MFICENKLNFVSENVTITISKMIYRNWSDRAYLAHDVINTIDPVSWSLNYDL